MTIDQYGTEHNTTHHHIASDSEPCNQYTAKFIPLLACLDMVGRATAAWYDLDSV